MAGASSSLYDFLSQGFCSHCSRLLKSRIEQLDASGALEGMRLPTQAKSSSSSSPSSSPSSDSTPGVANRYASTPEKHEEGESRRRVSLPAASDYGSVLRKGLTPSPVHRGWKSEEKAKRDAAATEGVESDDLVETSERDERMEWARVSKVGRKKDFRFVERIKGKNVNILQGLELHTNVFNSREQEKIVNLIYRLQNLGREGKLRERTYSEPRKWMRGKGRVTLQFGCCYNYAEDKNGNPPGILRTEEVDPLPPLFKLMIQRLVRWCVLPPSCVPNSCIVNIYDKGDCIPPHIDHHDFLRPFCTISFLAECNILFGQNIEVAGPGEFAAPIAIPLPTGSVFILNGNGADIAKHCVPGVPAKRISITFRKMDPAKIPYSYTPDPKLQGIVPLTQPPTASPQMVRPTAHQFSSKNPSQRLMNVHQRSSNSSESIEEINGIFKLTIKDDDFPPLGGSSVINKRRQNS